MDKVFHFYAVDHVRNHPRWDSDIEPWLDSDSPIGVGTIIHRRNKRSGTPVEGTMEVFEFEPNRVIAMVVHDGPVEMRGRTTFEAISDNQTRITLIIDIPGMDASTDKTFLNSRLESSAQIRKQLIESEVQKWYLQGELACLNRSSSLPIKKSSRAKPKSTRSIIKK